MAVTDDRRDQVERRSGQTLGLGDAGPLALRAGIFMTAAAAAGAAVAVPLAAQVALPLAILGGAALVGIAAWAYLRWELGRLVQSHRALALQGRIVGEVAGTLKQGLVVLDARGVPVFQNAVLRSIFGALDRRLKPSEWVTHFGVFEPDEVTPTRPEDLPLLAAVHGEAVSDRRFFVRNAQVPEGRHIRVSSAPLFDSRRRRIGAVAMFADISEEVRLGEQLRQVQRLDAIGQLTGGIAHDFNNLLTIILGNAASILDGGQPLDDWTRGDVELIVEAARRGTDLTHRLLSIARREAFEPTVCDVNVLISDVKPLLERTLGGSVEILLDLHDAPLMVRIDAGEFENALVNLAVNARDAMPDGGKLSLRTQQLPAEGGAERRVRITVADTGPGIPESIREAIFDPFFTTKDVGVGSGLGLSMVHGFARQSGGQVQLDTSVELGACFLLDLPEHDGETPRPRTDRTASRPGLPFEERTRPEAGTTAEAARILVVEDDEHVANLLRRVLSRMGHRLVFEHDAAAGLARIDAGESFDLLLSDIVLPGGMDGVQLMREARLRRPGLRVLLVSGYDRRALEGAALPEHEVLFLKKPFTRADLKAAVDSLVGQVQLRL
ncbi:MAG: ATP-binding protein [Pseudomonadales bacterium]|jgi:signal transduction histidine kinase/CheY-like chemotaxis protein|nr:ATP-binding protein [Pseudomonadales bacterium]